MAYNIFIYRTQFILFISISIWLWWIFYCWYVVKWNKFSWYMV